MNYKDVPPITPELWISNLLEAAGAIADKEHQEQRWLARDAYAWERPEELISSLIDDCVFDGFLAEYAPTLSGEQRQTALDLKDHLSAFCDATPVWLDAASVLADPRWHEIRRNAAAFVDAFRGKWPSPTYGLT